MGSLWAARLWQHAQSSAGITAATPVTLLLRDMERLHRWQDAGGLRLREGNQEIAIPVPAAVAGRDHGDISLLLVCTKAQDALPALRSVADKLQDDARVVLLQNGVRVQQEALQQFPALQLYCLSTSHGAYMEGTATVVHAGRGEAWLGSLHRSPVDEDLLARLDPVRMQVRWDADIEQRLWMKFAINCAVNALTVIYDCRNGELLERKDAHAELQALCAEIDGLLQALPIATLSAPVYPATVAVLQATARNFSSTLQDVRHGRRTEVPYFNEYLCELAQTASLPCPHNRSVLKRFHESEQKTLHRALRHPQ